MALAANALTTYTAVIAHASVSQTQAQVEQIINEVSEGVEDYLGRKLGYKVFDSSNPEQQQGRDQLWLYLSRRPIYDVDVVKINGTAVTDYSQTEEGDEKGKIYRVGGWPSSAPLYPDVTSDPDFTRLPYNIWVEYEGGFILPQYGGVLNATHNPHTAARDLPYTIEAVVIEAVIAIAVRPIGDLVEEATAGGWRRKWAGPMTVKQRDLAYAALNKYKRNWFA